MPDEKKEGLISRVAKLIGKAGKDKPRDGSEGPPRPELGQFGITGDARFAPQIRKPTWDNSKKEWVLAHRLDRVSYRDYDRVRYYPTVRDALTAIRLPLERANFHFECADQHLADLAMQEIGPHIHNLVSKLAKGGLEFGRQTAEKVWELKTNVKVSGSQSGTGPVETIYPFLWTIKRFAYFSPEDTDILIFPHTGEFAAIRQYVVHNNTRQDIGKNKLIHFVHEAEHDSNFGTPRTKSAIPFVDLATSLYDDASLYFSRFACPTLIGYAPATKREAGVDSDGKPIQIDSMNWMKDTLSKIRNAHAVVLPTEFDMQNGNPKWSIQPLELGERGLFVEYALHLNTMIGASLCVPQLALSTVPSSGTYNLGQTQIDLFTQNEEALLDSLRDVINADLLDDFRVFNMGHDSPPLTIVFEPVSTDVSQMLLQGLVQNLVMGAPMFTPDGQQIVPDWLKLAADKGVPFTLQQPGVGGMPPGMPGMPGMPPGMPGAMPPGGAPEDEEGAPDPGAQQGAEGAQIDPAIQQQLDQQVQMSEASSHAASALKMLMGEGL